VTFFETQCMCTIYIYYLPGTYLLKNECVHDRYCSIPTASKMDLMAHMMSPP